jgi:phosphopantetheine adenylyltransferase
MKKTGNQIIDNYNIETLEPELKEGYTMERAIKIIEQKKELAKKIHINKEIAMDLLQGLDNINKDEIQSIEKLIDQTKDMETLNIIIRSLNKAYCFHNELNSKILENKIKDEKTNTIF